MKTYQSKEVQSITHLLVRRGGSILDFASLYIGLETYIYNPNRSIMFIHVKYTVVLL